MLSAEKEKPAKDIAQWRERLQKELKSPLSLSDLEWHVSEYFSLDEGKYLTEFHEAWKQQKPDWKPAFKVSASNLNPSDIATAETYGFQAWVVTDGTSFSGQSLPVEHRLGVGNPSVASSGICFDPVMDSLRLGAWTPSFQQLNTSSHNGPFHIHAADVQNAGGSAVQELAFCLLVAEQYRQSVSAEEFAESCQNWVLHLASSPSYWLEIGKIRAMRLLWMNFCSLNNAGKQAGKIEVETSGVFWSHTDPDGNLLRHTSEVMSALIAGADSILVHSHTLDPSMGLEACRQAVNIGLLATKESHLDNVLDPATGSYLVEKLTHELTNAAWNQFIEWNEKPFVSWIESGEFQSLVAERKTALQTRFASGDLLMVGVNKHQSPLARKSPAAPIAAETETSFPALRPFSLDV
jgi:hypothetical protein